MRITALSSLLALGILGLFGGSAHADRKQSSANAQVAALVDPARLAAAAPTRVTGDLGLTGAAGRPSTTSDATRPPRRERHLTTADVSEVVASRMADIERCYLDAVGTSRGGKLDLMFVIARDGHVLSIDTAAPGASVRATHKIHACIRSAVELLQFPARRGDTTAVVPYVFQKTEAPNAGPQLSCWNPRGC